jgi:hypothetical protein
VNWGENWGVDWGADWGVDWGADWGVDWGAVWGVEWTENPSLAKMYLFSECCKTILLIHNIYIFGIN